MKIEVFVGDRDDATIQTLLAMADDSTTAIAAYVGAGTMLVARDHDGVIVGDGDGDIVGLALCVPGEAGTMELKALAVAPSHQGGGVGTLLVNGAVRVAIDVDAYVLTVATATADIQNIAFYQRRGFRCLRIERDAFTEATGYRDDLVANGIRVRDRIWLDRPVGA